MDTSKLLAIILNKVFYIYNEKEYRKYFIQLNLDIEGRTKKFIVYSVDINKLYSVDTNKYSINMYYHYYIYLTIVPDLLKEEIPDLLGE